MTSNIPYSRIGITGSRNFSDLKKMREFITSLPAGISISVGDCRGADKAASSLALSLGISIIIYSADWQRYGKAAGPIRNKQIIDSGIEALYAFPDVDLDRSIGTRDCVRQAKKAGIPVFFP